MSETTSTTLERDLRISAIEGDLALLTVLFESIVRTAQRLGAAVDVSLHNVDRDVLDTASGIRNGWDDTRDGVFVDTVPFWSKQIARVDHEAPHASRLQLYTDEPPADPTHPAWHLEQGDDGLYTDHCYACWLEAQRRAESDATP